MTTCRVCHEVSKTRSVIVDFSSLTFIVPLSLACPAFRPSCGQAGIPYNRTRHEEPEWQAGWLTSSADSLELHTRTDTDLSRSTVDIAYEGPYDTPSVLEIDRSVEGFVVRDRLVRRRQRALQPAIIKRCSRLRIDVENKVGWNLRE